MSQTNFRVAQLYYAEIKHYDWLKKLHDLEQPVRALFDHSYATLKFVCDFDSKLNLIVNFFVSHMVMSSP